MIIDDNKSNLMLDLETYDTAPTAVILQIGMVLFDSEDVIDKFSVNVSIQDQLNKGRTVSGDTLMWWSKQLVENPALLNVFNNPIGLDSSLGRLGNWLGGVVPNKNERVIWGNGVDFDNVVLADAYKTMGWPLSWSYKNNACYRTIKNMYPDITFEQVGNSHNALDDAEYQARHLIKINAYDKNRDAEPQVVRPNRSAVWGTGFDGSPESLSGETQ